MAEPRSSSALSAARAYRAALARLVRGEGRHPDHQGRIVRISPASVAREAAKSRNPLYTTHRDILDEMLAMSSADIRVTQDPERMRPSDIPSAIGDGHAMRNITGWQPAINLHSTLEQLLAYWRLKVATTS